MSWCRISSKPPDLTACSIFTAVKPRPFKVSENNPEYRYAECKMQNAECKTFLDRDFELLAG